MEVTELDHLVEQLAALKKEREALDEKSSELHKKYQEMQTQLMGILKETGRKSYPTPFGTIYIREDWRVGIPRSEEDKKVFFSYLKEKGVLWDYATVNSNSLCALFNKEWDLAKERGEGMEFKIPGISDPQVREVLVLKTGTGKESS